MFIDAIRFLSRVKEVVPQQRRLDLTGLEHHYRELRRPEVYLVKRSQVDQFLKEGHQPFLAIASQGRNGRRVPGKQLGRIFFKEKRPEYVEFDFRGTAQIARSLRALLARASGQHHLGMYLVGTDDESFEAVARHASSKCEMDAGSRIDTVDDRWVQEGVCSG